MILILQQRGDSVDEQFVQFDLKGCLTPGFEEGACL